MRSSLAARWILALGLVAAVAGACRQTIGIDQYFNAPADAGAGACGAHYGSGACASCAATSCCAESNACASSPACDPYETCLGKCVNGVNGDPQCRSQCTIDHPVGKSSEASALSACLASKCETACGLTCGGLAGYVSEPPSAASCQSCIETTSAACTHARACGSSVECDAYWRCVLSCPTEDCQLACGRDHDAGAALFAPFAQDYAGACAGPCAYGNYWACVGHVNWPVAKSSTWMVAIPVIEYFSHNGVPGLDVSVCTGCPCDLVTNRTLAQGVTDANGTVTLQLPVYLLPTARFVFTLPRPPLLSLEEHDPWRLTTTQLPRVPSHGKRTSIPPRHGTR